MFAPILYTRAGGNTRVYAAASKELNFQARLLTGSGAIVPDGNYSIQFNLYNVVSGGTTQWTETQGTVAVRAGYVSVYLGSVTTFPGTIDWSQQQWLTMNVNGDGEMTPRLKLTAVPNALHANEADTLRSGVNLLTADNFAQLTPATPQVINSALAALRLNQTGAGLLTQLQHNGTDVFNITNNGDLTSSGSATFSGGSLILGTATQVGGLVLKDGAGKKGTVQTTTLSADQTYTFPNASGTVCLTTTCSGAANAFINGGNSFGSAPALGTNDSFALNFRTSNTNQLTLDTSGNLNFLNGGLQIGGTTVVTSGRVLQNVTADTSILTTGTLGAARGGTGLNTYAIGDLLYASGTTALSSLSDVVSGNVLLSGGIGAAPTWGKVALGTHTTGNYVASLGTLTGLTVTGNSGAGSTPALSVTYGSAANTAAQGNTALSLTGSGNLTGTVSGTAGGGITTNTLNVVNNPSFSGLITGSAGTTGLALTGAPTNSATSSLIQIGSAIAAGNTAANGGTYLGLNTPNSGAGSAADFLNFQVNGISKLKVSNSGLIDSAGGLAIGGTTVITSGRVLQNITLDTGTITTGILAVNRGGTGLDGSTAANGQLLIGNGSGYSLGTLANNGGLTISNSAGGIGLAVNYGSTSTTAVRGDTALICPSGSGNLNGGGNTITLGTGGTCSALDTKAAVTFVNSVTTPLVTNAGLLTISTTGSNDLTITSGSGLLVLNASTLRRTAVGTTTFDLVDGSNTTLNFTNSGAGNLNLSADGTVTAGSGLTVTSGGASITGNTSVASGTFTSSGGLISLNDASNFGTKINTGSSTGTITIGGGSAPLVIDSTAFDVTSTGNVSTTGTYNTNTFTGTALTFGGVSGVISTTSNGNLTIGPAGSGVLALNTGSGGTLTTNASTIQRSGATGMSVDLANAGTTTLTVTNSDASNVANLSVEGGITAGTNSAFSVNSDGDVTGVARQLDGSSTANGASAGGLGSATSLTLVSAANFDIGNYVRVTSANCGGTGISPCYAKITAKSTNTLTIAPALTWTNGSVVVEFHFPEIGGVDASQTLTNRYGRGYFISGVATGNGTTYYNEDSIVTSLTTFDLLNTGVTTLNIGGAATTVNIGNASGTTTIAGNVSFSGNVTAPTTGTSGYLQRAGTVLSPSNGGDSFTTSGNISTSGSGTITAAAGLTIQGGGASITGNSSVTGTLGVSSTLTVSAGGASITGGLTVATGALNLTSGGITNVGTIGGVAGLTFTSGALNLNSGGITNAGSIAGASTLSLSGAITGATATNTINGLVINSGALSSITGITFTSGSLNLNNGGLSNGGAFSGLTTLSLSGAITGPTSTNTINGLVINSGALSSISNIVLSGTISGGTTITGTTLNASTGINTGAGAGTQRIDNSGNLVNIASLSLTGSANGLTYMSFNTAGANPTYQEGRLFYDNTQKALSYYNSEAAVTLNIGQENYVYVYNNTASTINDGQSVYINGTSGGVPTIGLAKADALTTAQAIGVATHSIEAGTFGFVTNFGEVNNLNTSGFTAGDTLYVSAATAGLLTNVRPSQPNFSTPVGRVTDVNASTGKIEVIIGNTRFGGYTAGRLAFGGSDGDIKEDSNLVWDNTNKRLGIGGTPAQALDVVGNIQASSRFYVPGTSGTNGQGFFTGTATIPLGGFQSLDLSGNTYSFLGNNKSFNGTTWVDNGLGRVGSSFQIQNDAFTFYSFDTAANFTPRFTVASGGNVGIGLSGAPAGLLSVGGTTGNFQVSSGGAFTATSGVIQVTGTGAPLILNRTDGVIGSLKSGSAKVAFLFDNTGTFGIGTDTRANIAAGNTAGTDLLSVAANGNITVTAGLSGLTTLSLSGAITGATAINTINGLIISSGALSGATTINASGLITSAGLTAGSGLVQGTGGLTFTGSISLNASASTNTTSIGTGTTSGQVTIGGGTAPLVINSTAFDVSSAGALSGITTIDTSSNINTSAGVFQVGGTSGLTIAACTAGQYLGNGVATKGGIITAGTCRNDATGISDVRVKKDITSVGSVLDKLEGVRVVTFNFKVDELPELNLDHGLQYGVIAQELEQIFPELVQQRDDGYKEVNFKGLSFYTLKAVTELATKVDAIGGGVGANEIKTDGVLRLSHDGILQNITGFNIISGGATIAGGINNNGGGITNLGAVLGATTISAQSLTLNANSSDNLLTLSKDSKGVFTVFNNGALGLQIDATNAFGVKNAAGISIFAIDTQNGQVMLGSGSAAKTVLFILDSRSTLDDPTGTNGASYYNAAAGRFRCYQDNRWQDCLPAGDISNSIAADKVSWLQPLDDNEFPGTPRVVTSLTRAHEFRLSMRLTVAAAANATCRLQYANSDNGPWSDLAATGGNISIDQTGTLKSDWVKISGGARAKDDTIIRVMCKGGDSTQTAEFYGVTMQLR